MISAKEKKKKQKRGYAMPGNMPGKALLSMWLLNKDLKEVGEWPCRFLDIECSKQRGLQVQRPQVEVFLVSWKNWRPVTGAVSEENGRK